MDNLTLDEIYRIEAFRSAKKGIIILNLENTIFISGINLHTKEEVVDYLNEIMELFQTPETN